MEKSVTVNYAFVAPVVTQHYKGGKSYRVTLPRGLADALDLEGSIVELGFRQIIHPEKKKP